MWARVIPIRSQTLSATKRLASTRSTTRVVAIKVSAGSARRITAAGPAMALSATDGGGTIHVEVAGTAEWPSASETKSIRPARRNSPATRVSCGRNGPGTPRAGPVQGTQQIQLLIVARLPLGKSSADLK